MLSLQKSASGRTGLGYDFSSPSIASTSTTIFVPPSFNVESENNYMKNVLASQNIENGNLSQEHPLNVKKKKTKNLRAKKGNTLKA